MSSQRLCGNDKRSVFADQQKLPNGELFKCKTCTEESEVSVSQNIPISKSKRREHDGKEVNCVKIM